MTATARHALVIASQCAAMPFLDGLEDAADELHAVLTDPALGCCVAALPGRSGVVSDPMTSGEVTDLITEAVQRAAKEQAVLVLALLGHGFRMGDSAGLYFMTVGSREYDPYTAVDVSHSLGTAAHSTGLSGLIGVVDTCHAGGAIPRGDALAVGGANGSARMSLLMAGRAGEEVTDLRLSKALAEVMRTGVPELVPWLSPGSAAGRVNESVSGWGAVCYGYDGARPGAGPLWLAHNRGYAAARGVGGRLNTSRLAAALAAADASASWPAAPWDLTTLRTVTERLNSLPSAPAAIRAQQLADNMLVAVRTLVLLDSWLTRDLRTGQVRRALAQVLLSARRPPSMVPSEALESAEHVVEYIAFHHPPSDGSCRPWMARFVLELVRECGRDLRAEEVAAWAADVNWSMQVNDLTDVIERSMADRRLRLVVSLHASLAGGWPETLESWLLTDGKRVGHWTRDCRPYQQDVEEALGEAVTWAEDEAADMGVSLRQVDVAVPTRLLTQWHPEETRVHERLGVNYDVVVHWSERLTSSTRSRRINRLAAKKLRHMDADPVRTAPVDWLADGHVRDLVALSGHFVDGQYPRAVGLVIRPRDKGQLLQLVLEHSPIVLWPRDGRGVTAWHQQVVGTYWQALPAGFMTAYRARWLGGSIDHLADLRAVWDNQDWLDFCVTYQGPPRTAGNPRP